MIKNCSEAGERDVFANTSSQYSQAPSSLMGGSTDSRWRRLKEGRTDLIALDEHTDSGSKGSVLDRVEELARLVQLN